MQNSRVAHQLAGTHLGHATELIAIIAVADSAGRIRRRNRTLDIPELPRIGRFNLPLDSVGRGLERRDKGGRLAFHYLLICGLLKDAGRGSDFRDG